MTAPDHALTALIEGLQGLMAKATPGPWGVWREKCASPSDAVRELTEQVYDTHPFAGQLFLLNAGGKCPATTGCGPTSEANAALIVEAINALPTLLAALSATDNRAPVSAPAGEGCGASPDHADILETIANASDDWQKHG